MLLSIILCGSLHAEQRAEPASWTNRGLKTWASTASHKGLERRAPRPSSALAWRPADRREQDSWQTTSIPRSEFEPATADASDLSFQQMDLPPEQDQKAAKRIARWNLQQRTQRTTAQAVSPDPDPHRSPFGDAATEIESRTGSFDPWSDGEAIRHASATSDDPFRDPFGDGPESDPFSDRPENESFGNRPSVPREPAPFELRQKEPAEQLPFQLQAEQRLPAGRALGPRSKPGNEPAVAWRSPSLHEPQVAFQTPDELQLNGVPAPDGIPEPRGFPDPADAFSDLQDDSSRPSLEDVPEFPDFPAGPDLPPTPEGIPGNEELPQLPTPQEPPRPGTPNGRRDAPEIPDADRRLPELPTRPELDGGGVPDDFAGQPDDEAIQPIPRKDRDRQDAAACDRVYNDRNCCTADEHCRDAWDRLQAETIDKISVNISPDLVPLAEDEIEIEEQRNRLKKSPVREWRNRNGTIVATGRLDDLQYGRVVIRTEDGRTEDGRTEDGRTEDGQTIDIPFYELNQDDLCFVTAWWQLPTECLIESDRLAIRDWTLTTFTWKASGVCHKPLYFEDVQLERYGHSAGPVLQPLLSGAHFFANIALLPYQMGVYPPSECRYTLGYYRPGSCAPWLVPAFPLSKRGAAVQAGTMLGLWGIFF